MKLGERPRVVVIEDDPEVARMIRDALETCGFTVMTARHPAELWKIADEAEPDLMLMDLLLPGMTGCALAARLREIGYAHTPMIAMSADRITLHFAGRSGLFQGTLAKPFDLTQLLEHVGRHVGMYVT